VTQRGGVATSARGEATPEREKGGDDASWTDENLTRPKIKKITWSIRLLEMDDEDLKQR
jgi:hypothetical protein